MDVTIIVHDTAEVRDRCYRRSSNHTNYQTLISFSNAIVNDCQGEAGLAIPTVLITDCERSRQGVVNTWLS